MAFTQRVDIWSVFTLCVFLCDASVQKSTSQCPFIGWHFKPVHQPHLQALPFPAFSSVHLSSFLPPDSRCHSGFSLLVLPPAVSPFPLPRSLSGTGSRLFLPLHSFAASSLFHFSHFSVLLRSHSLSRCVPVLFFKPLFLEASLGQRDVRPPSHFHFHHAFSFSVQTACLW